MSEMGAAWAEYKSKQGIGSSSSRGSSTAGSTSSGTRKLNPWNEFCKQHKGEGLSSKELSQMYRDMRENRNSYDPQQKTEAVEDMREMLYAMLEEQAQRSRMKVDDDMYEDLATYYNLQQEQQSMAREKFNRTEERSLKKMTEDAIRDEMQDVEATEIPYADLDFKEEIGEGAFGTVHAAKWKDKPVAVKMLKADFNARRFTSFKDEVKTLAKLKDDGVTRLYGYTLNKDKCGLVMEYMPDGSLWNAVMGMNAPSEGPVYSLCRTSKGKKTVILQMLDALAYLHDKGVAHRDIKLHNVLVNGSLQKVSLCDFGLSSFRNNATSSATSVAGVLSGSFVGTVKYGAPEVLSGDIDDEDLSALKAADVYAMAMTITELLLEDEVWFGWSPQKITKQVVKNDARPTKELEECTKEKEGVRKAIEKAWSRDPKSRPSARELYKLMSTALETAGV